MDRNLPAPAVMAAAVAEEFGLGAVEGELRPVAGGGSHLMFRLRTAGGEWAVKRLNRPHEAWWVRDYEIAARIEAVAFAHGISMPRPVEPAHPAATLLADLPEGSFRVHGWCAGQPVVVADDAMQRWVGRTLAAIHALPVGLHVADAESYEPHEMAEWDEWMAGSPPDVVATVSPSLPDIARAKDLVDHARQELAGRLTPVFSHRDFRPVNVLLAATGPVLLDWDGAGIDVAEWEAVRVALAFGRQDRIAFRRIVEAYVDAGGTTIPATPGAFAGVLRGQLGAAAWLLWRVLGHRPVTPAEREASARSLVDVLAELRVSLAHLDEWAGWLR